MRINFKPEIMHQNITIISEHLLWQNRFCIIDPCSSAMVNIIKHFTIVIYDSIVVIWGVFKSGMTLEL